MMPFWLKALRYFSVETSGVVPIEISLILDPIGADPVDHDAACPSFAASSFGHHRAWG